MTIAAAAAADGNDDDDDHGNDDNDDDGDDDDDDDDDDVINYNDDTVLIEAIVVDDYDNDDLMMVEGSFGHNCVLGTKPPFNSKHENIFAMRIKKSAVPASIKFLLEAERFSIENWSPNEHGLF